jgi:outer membrane protein TolC
MKFKKYIFFIGILWLGQVHAQNAGDSLLTKRDAVDMALENNYDIKIAEGNVEQAENNAGVMNSGYLPSVSASGGANYNVNDNLVEYQDGTSQDVTGAQAYSFNGGLALNYTVFNGLGRKYNYERLKENYNLSELQARQVIENSILNLFAVYYEVARLTQNVNSQIETIEISKRRLQRAKYGYEYGQNTQLDVLNAEVDFNNDSITFLSLRQELENVKRDINVLLGRDVNVVFAVDTAITYMKGLMLGELMENAMKNNVGILQQEGILKNTGYDINISKADLIPRLGISAAYNYTDRSNDPTSFLKHQTSLGPTVSANLSWNIFDGGNTMVRVQNAKIAAQNQLIAIQQTKQVLQRNVNNAWGFYQNALFVLEAEKKNLQTNQRNFDRTVEQQKLGQISSIEFRQAQVNLINAQLNYNRAKYSAKTAELALLQLSGDLMSAEF